jgi:hypothetical protein
MVTECVKLAQCVLNTLPQNMLYGLVLRSSSCNVLCGILPPPPPGGVTKGQVCIPVFSSQPQAPLWDMRASILSASATTAREAPLDSWATKPT